MGDFSFRIRYQMFWYPTTLLNFTTTVHVDDDRKLSAFLLKHPQSNEIAEQIVKI